MAKDDFVFEDLEDLDLSFLGNDLIFEIDLGCLPDLDKLIKDCDFTFEVPTM